MRHALIVWSAAALFAACKDTKSNPTTEAPVPKPARPSLSEPEAPVPKPSGTLKLSPENTKVRFVGSKVIGSHDGEFHTLSGSIDFKNGDPLTAVIKVAIDLASVKTDAEKLDGHLKSPDFFDVAKFPKATFESSGVTAGGADEATHTISGDLTLRGVKKAISIPAKITLTPQKVSVSSEFTINRKDYGIVYPGMPDNLIKDDVVIKLSIDSLI